jgi:hypothetical protein
MWNFCNGYLGYATRVMTYLGLMHDEFPPFGTDRAGQRLRNAAHRYAPGDAQLITEIGIRET